MRAIVAILAPGPDGSGRLPAPEELRHGKVKVVATMTAVEEAQKKPRPKAGSLKGFWMAPDFDAPLEDLE